MPKVSTRSRKSINTEITVGFKLPTKLPGFNRSYDVSTPVSKIWRHLFQENEIPFDRRNHMLVRKTKQGTFEINIEHQIDLFYKEFKANLKKYTAYIQKRRISTVLDQEVINIEGQIPVVCGRGPPENIIENGNAIPMQIDMNQPTRPVPHSSRALPNFSVFIEDTKGGNFVGTNEQNVQDTIRTYLTSRISNADMLRIRKELKDLLDSNQYERLQRIVPFTSGVLRTAFMDSVP